MHTAAATRPVNLGLNYPESPDSCLLGDLAFIVDVLEVLADRPNVDAEQVCQLRPLVDLLSDRGLKHRKPLTPTRNQWAREVVDQDGVVVFVGDCFEVVEWLRDGMPKAVRP